MLLFNLLILLMVIILSYVFKLSEVKKYDIQLVYILLTFTVLIMYKTLNYIYNKREKQRALKLIAEKFMNSDRLNDFISDTLSDSERIKVLEKKIKEYEDVYDTKNILNNNLENKIKFAENALSKLADQYIVDLENANPAGENVQIKIEASEKGISTNAPDVLSGAYDVNAVKDTIITFLKSVASRYPAS